MGFPARCGPPDPDQRDPVLNGLGDKLRAVVRPLVAGNTACIPRRQHNIETIIKQRVDQRR